MDKIYFQEHGKDLLFKKKSGLLFSIVQEMQLDQLSQQAALLNSHAQLYPPGDGKQLWGWDLIGILFHLWYSSNYI